MKKSFISWEIYYYPYKLETGEMITIDNEEAHHIIRVMRHKVGDKIKLTDGRGFEYEGIIKKIFYKEKKLTIEILKKEFLPREPNVEITLASSPLKGENTEIMLSKAVELGIRIFQPVYFKNTVAKISENKLKRLVKVAVSSLKTCAGTILPQVAKPLFFQDLIKGFSSYDEVLLAYEDSETKLSTVLNKKGNKILLIIGPEGGFAEEEIKIATQKGAKLFSLGKRRLRSETAAIVALSLILYEFNNI
uniref:Ribosomal RNA small subunit methyltransferase E n=1 Tax=candidate division WOR-3 bacterium TaxID=2052148 RepID=A0A7V4E3F0_UNCW3